MDQTSPIIIRYGELGLKGSNRILFIRKLAKNIINCLRSKGDPNVQANAAQGRIMVSTTLGPDALQHIPGITSYSKAVPAGNTIAGAFEKTRTHLFPIKGTFCVRCQRIDKQFPLTSHEVNQQLGSQIQQATGAKVNLTKPDTTITCEIINNTIYICTSHHVGTGGLPGGTGGHIVLLARKQEDLLTGIPLLRRGCTLTICCPPELDFTRIEQYTDGNPIRRAPEEEFTSLANKTHLAAVPDTLTTICKYNLCTPIIRPLIGAPDGTTYK